jgi:1-acyl-sn-glycerol-3-phosphate acyltransferase
MNYKKPVKTFKLLSERGSKFIMRLFFRVFFGCRYHYEQPIPLEGPVIIAPNHTSYFDPPGVGAGVYRQMHFFAKRELFRNLLFRALIRFYNAIPVRRGVMDWKAVAEVKALLKAGGAIMVFPEGTRSRDGRLGKAKFGAGMLAQETGAIIVPVYVHGTNRPLDAFLRRRPFEVFFGKQIRPEQYADLDRSTKSRLAISEMIIQRIAAMQKACEERDSLSEDKETL